MLVRIPLLLAAFALAFASSACASLTRPDEIMIAPEPPPAPKPVAVPQAAQPAMQQAGAPGSGG